MNSGELKLSSVYEWQAPSRRNRFGVSAVLHAIAIVLLIKLGAFTAVEVSQQQTKHETLTWIAPEPAPQPPLPSFQSRKNCNARRGSPPMRRIN